LPPLAGRSRHAHYPPSEFIPAGKYEWTSFKTKTDYTIRASLKKR